MNDTIYLICTPKGVDRMVKTASSATNLRKNEVPVKLKLDIDSDNWRPPFIEKQVKVCRWDKNVDIEDVAFEGDFVTEEEAQMIRDSRLQKMKERLEQHGFTVTRIEEGETDE